MGSIEEKLSKAFEIERQCMQAYRDFVDKLEKRRKERENETVRGKRA